MRLKIVCINLQRSTERRNHIEKTIATRLKPFFPFEFYTACDYMDIALKSSVGVTVGDDKSVNVTFDDESKIPVRKIYHKDKFTGLCHNPRRFLDDQVEEFGRKHFQVHWNLPYEKITCVDDTSDDKKKWIIRDGKFEMFVDTSNFRKLMTPPEIACALSHYSVMQMLIADDEYDAYLVLEDDVSLLCSVEKFQEVISHIETYELMWDMVMLNHARFITPNTLAKITPLLSMSVLSTFTNACSYIVNKATAKELVNRMNGFINLTADDFLARQIHLRILRVNEACFSIGNDTFQSTIRTGEFA